MKRKLSWRELPRNRKPTAEESSRYPTMTGWFSPGPLIKLLWRVIVSGLFGQYADRRLIVAALDPATKSEIRQRDDLTKALPKDSGGAVWIDFVADLGDGFDSSYAIAYLLAQENLVLRDKKLLELVRSLWGAMKFIRLPAATHTTSKSARLIILRTQIKLKSTSARFRYPRQPRLVRWTGRLSCILCA